MAGTQTSPLPFRVYEVTGSSNALPQMRHLPEKASLTTLFKGVPAVVSSGYVIVRTTIDGVTKVIAGITNENCHNLGSDGTAPIGGSGVTFGNVQNQPSAKNIPIGAPMADGTIELVLANDETIFIGATDAAHTVAVTDIGTIYGLTVDATTNLWFVDCTITAAASGACVEVVDIPPDQIGVVGGQVAFKITRAYQQLFT